MNLAKHQPPGLSGVLERERLLAKLASWTNRKLVIIHGPAGQGKSSLAADHLRSLNATALWYSLDSGDDDPHLFLECLGRLVQRTFPGAVPAPPAVPRDRYRASDPSPAIAGWIRRLFQDVPPCLLVFDDFHMVNSSPALPALLAMIIEATPPAVRVMVLSRTRPDLALGRLRSQRAVGELAGPDLRFTEAEVSELFDSVFGLRLPRSRAAEICRTTEGWAVGLVLMHEYLSTTGADRADDFAGRLQPEFRDQVFDYLACEVFSHLDPALQSFLLRTSVADYVPLPLATLLTSLPETAQDRASVGSMLAELGKRSLFADTGGEERTIRYHALFREFLKKQLALRLRPAEVRRLHTTAANFFRENRCALRAIELFIASEQHPQAARLLERSCGEFIGRGQIRTVLRMIDRLPQDLQDRPWFLFTRAVACRFSDPRTALRLYDRALAGFHEAGNTGAEMLTLSGIIEALFHSGGDFRRMERAVVRARSLLRNKDRGQREARAHLLQAIGTASFFTGSLRQGIEALRGAMDLFGASGNHFSQITCAIYLTPCALYHGDFPLAREAVRRGFQAQRSAPDEPGGEAALYLVQAMADLFEGAFAKARESLETCRRLTEEYRLASIDLLMLTFSGWLRIAEGDHRSAERMLELCMQRGETAEKTFFSLSAAHFLSISCLFQKKLERAKQLSDYTLSGDGRTSSRLFRAIYLILSGSIHRELGRHRHAEQHLLEAIRTLRACDAAQQEANAHLALASLYLRRKRTEQAHGHLKRGFAIGRERGLTYYALLTPDELGILARTAAEQGICADYCSGLAGRSPAVVAAPVLHLFCFGGFRVRKDDALVSEQAWKGKRSKQLVKLLLSRAGRPLSRDAVIEAVRPDCDPAQHSSAMANLLHRVRKVLDSPGNSGTRTSCIRYENDHLSFDRSRVWTDVDRFLAALSDAQAADSRTDPGAALRHYDEALALYQGDFLPEDLYEEWSIAPREDLRSRYLKALERSGEIAVELGDRQRAAAFQERLFSADQCNEKACRWIMTNAVSEGRRSDAIRAYERCQLALRHELDIEPEEKTRRVYRSIIGGE